MKNKKYSMFWNWIRWQCLNKKDWNLFNIPKGTVIDDDQASMEIIKILRQSKRR